MHTEYHKWWSPHLNRDMELKVYGHWGKPYIVFPCSRGRFFDFEGMGMVDRISGYINAGRIKLIAVDSVDNESWYNLDISPAQRDARHETYDAYLVREVIPFIRRQCDSDSERPMATGASMGAYHAMNFFLKHPDLCLGTIALSGLYRLDRSEFSLGPEHLADVYYNSPLAYLPGLQDSWYLDWYRQSIIIACSGQGAWEHEALEDTRRLEQVFMEKGIPAWMDIWGLDVNHDWPWWYIQMNHFLSHLHGTL